MANIRNHESSDLIKLLLLSDSGGGKSSLMASLANVGYNVRILDYDNGLGAMISYLLPDAVDRVDYETLTIFDAKSYNRTQELLTDWKTKDSALGKPSSWGKDDVLVFDSTSLFGELCLEKARSLDKTGHMQAVYGTAIDLFKDVVREALYTLPCNIVCNAHLQYQDEEGVGMKCYPKSLSRGFNPDVPKYFNNMWLIEAKTDGKRILRTIPNHRLMLKNTAPQVLLAEEPIDMRTDPLCFGKIFKKVVNNSRRVLDTKPSGQA